MGEEQQHGQQQQWQQRMWRCAGGFRAGASVAGSTTETSTEATASTTAPPPTQWPCWSAVHAGIPVAGRRRCTAVATCVHRTPSHRQVRRGCIRARSEPKATGSWQLGKGRRLGVDRIWWATQRPVYRSVVWRRSACEQRQLRERAAKGVSRSASSRRHVLSFRHGAHS